MTDPAVEAARRAFGQLWPEQGDFEFLFDSGHRQYAIRAAREALAPLRAWFEQRHPSGRIAEDATLGRIMNELAPLIYAEDEL